jgi:flagellar hook-associated protein 2
MPITTSGVGSGINIRELVDELIASESKDKTLRFDTTEAQTLTKISAYGSLKGSLSDFRSKMAAMIENDPFAKRMMNSVMDSNKTTILDGEVSNNAQTGNFLIEVTDLALSHKLGSKDFPDQNVIVGKGVLQFHVGTTTHSIEIDQNHQTLAQIKEKINENAKSTGITASIIQSDTNAVIVFQSEKTGLANAFTVSVIDDTDADNTDNTDNAGLSQLASNHLNINQQAKNASVKIDGVTVTSSTNTIQDAIEGVTLNLLNANTNDPVILKISLNKDASTQAIKDFVASYNETLESIQKLTTFNKDDPKAAGILLGDSVARNVQNQMRRILNTSNYALPLAISSLAQMGITSDRTTGKFEIDNYKLSSAVDVNYDEIGDLFLDPKKGILLNMEEMLDSYIQNDGIIKNRTKGLNYSIDLINEQRINLERHLIHFEERLISQFIAMDTIVASLRSTSDFLSQQLDSLAEPLSFRK